MSYFPPYIDSSGLHMPTYEERLSALTESYRAIFGQASELSESVPDYQLLSVFARSLDDASMLVQNALHQMNPQYASGAALDLLLPQYGLHRETGESDASARYRLLSVLAVNDRTMEQRILDEIYAVPHVGEAALFINDTDTTDDKGIPPHSICPVVYNGSLQKLAEAIFRSKPPGLSTYGSSTKQVVDENGVSHDVHIQRPDMSFITFSIFVNPLEGLDDATLFAVSLGLQAFCNQLKIGESLIRI